MDMFKKLTALIVLFTLLSTLPCLADGDETRILVVETTDIHGYIMDASSGDPATFQYRMAYIAHLIDEARDSALYDGVLLLDGGDLYQGTPVSSLTAGAAMRAVVDQMGYDAIALGNHEFDWGVTEYAADSDGTIAPYVLGDYFGDANTPILASDLYDAAADARVPFTKDYVVIEKAGKRIAVVGYIPDYSMSIMSEQIAPYWIDADLSHLDALVRQVNAAEHPDAMIVLAHDVPEPVAAVMDPELVALVAGGHSHEIAVGTAENGLPFMQGNCYAKGFASAVLVIDTEGTVTVEDVQYTDIMEDRARLFDTTENAARLDPEIMELSRATWDAVSEEMNEVLGYIDKPIYSEWKVGASSSGNWVTGLMLRATQPEGVVAAFYNTGGIRANLEIPDGAQTRNITVYDVYTIAPFGNSLLVYEISGAELEQLLIDGLKSANYGDQMTGLTFTYTATGDPDMDRAERAYTILSMTLGDGTEVDPDALYRVCTTSFSATLPGSVFEGKEPVVPEADAPIDNESMIRLLRKEGLENDGYISVDDGPRGVEADETQIISDAA